jgi:hypothetical protein
MNYKIAVVTTLLVLSPTTLFAAATPELSANGETPGMRVIVTGLTRGDGGTVTLRFQLVNASQTEFKTYGVLGDLYSMDAISLIDAANKKRYLVVKDAARKCICSDFKQDSVPGSRFNLWATFPAPPAGVQKVTVMIPAFEPIEAPITAAP